MSQTACVVGVGPGLGMSLVERFGSEGYTVGMMARSGSYLENVVEETELDSDRLLPIECDATDEQSVRQAFTTLKQINDVPEVVIYNAGAFEPGGIMDVDPDRFEECWKVNCHGAFLTARQVLPDMEERGSGTILFTGATAALRGSEGFSALAVGKFGLRALAQSMAREYGPKGIHVAHVVVDGQILTPRVREEFPDRDEDTFLNPDEIAENYWQLHQQDETTWTLEMDLRPYCEEF